MFLSSLVAGGVAMSSRDGYINCGCDKLTRGGEMHLPRIFFLARALRW